MPQIFYFCGAEEFHPRYLVKHAQLAEAVGFDGIMISDHFHPWVDEQSAAGFTWSTLGAMAHVTKTIKLVTGITTPLFRYHPGIIAQAAATIDRLSNGRFMLGVGTGENINEGPLGYEFPKYSERSARMSEALDIICSLFAGEKLTYNGQYYKTKSAKLYSPPAHKIPIYLAAAGPKSARLAAQKIEGIITSTKRPTKTLEKVINPAKEINKDIKVIATRWSVFAQNDKQAWEALQPWRGLRPPGRLEAGDPEELRKKADELPRSEILNKYKIVSSPEDYIKVYQPLITDIKADIIVIQTTSLDQEKTIKMLGEAVIPSLKS